MEQGKIIVHGTMGSQPTRAVYWFCLLNKIPFEFNNVNLAMLEHKSEQFLELNPFGVVPAVQDVDGFSLVESQAILRYLCKRFSCPDCWYPENIRERTRIDSYLEWHHLNTRISCAMFVRTVFLGPYVFGTGKPTAEKVKKSTVQLHKSLKLIDKVWLGQDSNGKGIFSASNSGTGGYICGMSSPTIADLSCFCELTQLHVLPEDEVTEIFSKYKHIMSWMKRMEQLPDYQHVHRAIPYLKNRFGEQYEKDKRASKL